APGRERRADVLEQLLPGECLGDVLDLNHETAGDNTPVGVLPGTGRCGYALGGCFWSFRCSVRRCILSLRAASEMLPLQSARMRLRYSHSCRSSDGTSLIGGERFPCSAASISSALAGLLR